MYRKNKERGFYKRRVISLLQLAVLVFNISARAEIEKLQSPFAWSVKKDGKNHYILGTFHAGVSMKKDVPCSNKIITQIESSDLIFLEGRYPLAQLNREDKVALFTGSKEKREGIMNRFSPEIQKKIIERKQAVKQIVMNFFPFQVVYRGNKDFKDLSEKTKKFLISHGADIQGNYADYFYFIYEILFYDVFFSFSDGIDLQVARIAQSNNIKIKALDNNSKLAQDLNSEIEDSKRPIQPVSRADIESFIENYDQLLEQKKQLLLSKSQLYISGDVEAFKSMQVDSEEVLLKKRNGLWLKKFREAHENPEYESLFLAGGTRHLVGSYNLIDQLKEEGFSINPITCPADTVQN